MAPQTSTKLTYEDYALLPDDGLRHEIVDGEHYVNPAPNLKHQRILLNLAGPMDAHVILHGLGVVVVAPYDVVLSQFDVVQPDVLFIRAARRGIITNANLQGAPDLAVEILSPSNARYDEVVKYKRYDALGVAEYWIIDPERESVKIHRRTTAGLTPVETPEPLETPLIPGFTIAKTALFRLGF